MSRFSLSWIVGIATWVSCASASAEVRSPWDLSRDDDLQISLVTFGHGDEIHEYFGHNVLMVEDKARGIGVLYNFGMFNFGPDMLPKYLTGQLEFWAAPTPVQETFANYIAQNRSIHVRELNLSPQKRRYLADRLSYYVSPEHRNYLYHHYFNNCSTKLRDLIDASLNGQLKRQASGPARFTFRGHTRRYTQHDPIIHMLLLLWMNDSMERPIRVFDEAYLPGELERMVERAQYLDDHGKRVPLVQASYEVFEARRAPIPEKPSRAWPGLLAVGCLLGAIALLLSYFVQRGSRVARALFGLHHMLIGVMVGVPGLVLFLFLFTKWAVTHYNENLFIANPLSFLFFPLGFWTAFGSKKALRWLGLTALALGACTLAGLVLKVLPNFDQDNHLPLSLIAPINLGCALAHAQLFRRARASTSAPAGATVAG